ncbi:hypothetical protein QR680_003513 [Steinernema hermaphroditum]|uniref:cathepsin X n=1 Tax=Steinernema hermaphroditum TaxID=289476 RepID=A0AA39HMZ3_9BILA|nr:hypothetical protein QR680_003513 [Steinernema hermaphroditum]
MNARLALFALLLVVFASQCQARWYTNNRLINVIVSKVYGASDEEQPTQLRHRSAGSDEDDSDSDEIPEDDDSDEEFPEDHTRRFLRKPCLIKRKDRKYNFVKTYPRPWEQDGFEASLPTNWDWRNVSGVDYCSPNRNQHIPVYCGSCWVFGSTGALNDRFNVARKNRWPKTMVSPQEIIDCNGRGTCQGGDVADVYEHAKKEGLVEEGCNNYKAINEKCTPFNRCGSCWPDNCFAIQNYTRYYIKDWGKVHGRENMMAEIHRGGPIACSIGATPKFELNYTSGVYSEKSNLESNHIVSVSGWGIEKETNTEYWIVRNSWGEAWGERGWFRVVSSKYLNGQGNDYNMGIEKDCYYADPDISNLD